MYSYLLVSYLSKFRKIIFKSISNQNGGLSLFTNFPRGNDICLHDYIYLSKVFKHIPQCIFVVINYDVISCSVFLSKDTPDTRRQRAINAKLLAAAYGE